MEKKSSLDLGLERHKTGEIKDFSVPDPHHLFVTATLLTTGKVVRKEALALPSLDSLENLHNEMDPEDGMVIGKKWAINEDVIKKLKSHGECTHFLPDHPLKFYYKLVPIRFADNLRSKGI